MTLLVIPNRRILDVSSHTHAVITNNIGTARLDDTDTQPALAMELASNVRFDEYNEVVRDANFNAVLERVKAANRKVKSLELVSIESATDKIALARAKAFLKLFNEEGLANRNARLVVRTADPRERAEIIRSGFLLDRAMVLR